MENINEKTLTIKDELEDFLINNKECNKLLTTQMILTLKLFSSYIKRKEINKTIVNSIYENLIKECKTKYFVKTNFDVNLSLYLHMAFGFLNRVHDNIISIDDLLKLDF